MKLAARRLVGAVALMGALGLAALPVVDERRLLPGQSFALRVDAGNVIVSRGEEPEVRVEGDLLPGQRLVWRESAARLSLAVDDRARLAPRPVALRMTVPAETSLALRLGDASLRLDGVGGERLRVEGDGGELHIATASPRLHAETRSGRVDVELAEPSRVRLASISGDLLLRAGSTSGLDARLESHSGHIRVRVPEGQGLAVRLMQASGNAELPAGVRLLGDGRMLLGAPDAAGAEPVVDGADPRDGRLRIDTFSGNFFLGIDPIAPTTP